MEAKKTNSLPPHKQTKLLTCLAPWRSRCFCEGRGSVGGYSPTGARRKESQMIEELKGILYGYCLDLDWIKDAGRRAIHLLGFCSALQCLLSTQPLGWGDGGEGPLSAICGRNKTDTHTRANGNSQQNKQRAEGACRPGVCNREGGTGEVKGHLPGQVRDLGVQGSGEVWSPQLPGESLSFMQLPGLKSQGCKASVSYNPSS